MGFFDKLKASVGIGQPKVEVMLGSATTAQDHGLIFGEIIITAQKTAASINEVKLELVHKYKTLQTVSRDGVESKEEVEKEGILYRVCFKKAYAKSFERVADDDRVAEKESGILDSNAEKNKIIIEANQAHHIPFQFSWSESNHYGPSEPGNTYTIRATVNMPGLDPKGETEIRLVEEENLYEYGGTPSERYAKKALELSAQSKTTPAFDYANKAVKAAPDNAYAYYVRGVVFLDDKKDFKAALEDLDKAISLPGSDRAMYYLVRGETKNKLNAYADAINDFNEAIKIMENEQDNGRTYAQAFSGRGIAKAGLGNKNEAREDILKGKQLGDYNADNYLEQYCQ